MRLTALIILFIIKIGFSQEKDKVSEYADSITAKELMENLYVYSSDYFQGRETGSIGQKRAVNFLQNFYRTTGIVGANGTKNYLQPMTLNIKGEKIETENVAAIIKGSEFPDQYIVISAHLDHIGIDSRGEINNGADDDGTGNVALLEIAEAFKSAVKDGKGPKRSLIFLHVTGEEKGLLGSKYYTENPLYPINNTITNLNIDMIGRVDSLHFGKPDYLYLIGSNILSDDLHKISEKVNDEYVGLELDYRYNDLNTLVYELGRYVKNRYYERSDHYNFAKKNIPVIFYFNGTHKDYHKPTDTPDKINYPLLEKRTKLIFHTAWELANRNSRIKLN